MYKIKSITISFILLIFTTTIFAFEGSTTIPAKESRAEDEMVDEESLTKLDPISIYDEMELLKISIQDIGKYHGDVCPCVIIAFRAAQLAIKELWGDEIPARGDFEIISANPTPGSKDTYEFITRIITRENGKDFKLDLPEGTDIQNLSARNLVTTFIRKSTGERIVIKVKPKVFPNVPGGFFPLRKKVKFNGKATPEEKKRFKIAIKKLKDSCINLPVSELFQFERKNK